MLSQVNAEFPDQIEGLKDPEIGGVASPRDFLVQVPNLKLHQFNQDQDILDYSQVAICY
jgi:hypothetical protein